MAFENYQDIQVGDVVECFEMEEVARSLATPGAPARNAARMGVEA
jgi:hypothetical protein